MKSRRSEVRRQAQAIPELKFENHALTSYAGLVVFQRLFASLDLKAQLRECFRHLAGGKIFRPATLFLQLIVHLLLGFRELRDGRAYHDDPLVARLLGLKRLPDVATLSRMLKGADEHSVEHLRRLLRELVLKRLASLHLARITLDFDGSVQSTRRHAEGTAVGYNKKRKGARAPFLGHPPHRRPDSAHRGIGSADVPRSRSGARPGRLGGRLTLGRDGHLNPARFPGRTGHGRTATAPRRAPSSCARRWNRWGQSR
jgi:hypothetical protein